MLKNRIKEFRELRGLSQRELAERLGTSQQQIDRLEKKEKDIKTNWLFNISKVLNVSVSDLTGENKDLGVASIKEIDVYGGCGSAAEAMVTNTTDKYGNTITADAVRQSWLVPYEYLNEIRCTPEDTRIIEALGDSMVPTIFSGDKVIVDVSSKGKIPSPPGIFVIWDGMGVAIKRIEYIPNSDPPAIRVISDNPNHPPFERTCDECQIIGRVIGLIKRV